MSTSPYVVNVATLIGRPGTMNELELDVTVPERIGEGMLYLDAGANLELDLRLESLVDGILATVDARAELTGECSRCLQPIAREWNGHVAELFGFAAGDESLDYFVKDDLIDLEGPLRDAVVLELPFQPLCEDGCLGLNPETGEKLTEPLPEPEADVDPRWAQLRELLEDGGDGADKREK